MTQQNATEPAFKNEYWDEKREGIYVDITTGEPLFILLINSIPVVVGRAFQNRLITT